MLTRLTLLIGAVVSTGLAACVAPPLETLIKPPRAMPGNALAVLLTHAQQHRICLGIEGTVGLRANFSIPSEPATFGALLRLLAPLHHITVSRGVVLIRDRPYTARTWLDYPLDFSTDRRWDAQLLVHFLLPCALLAQADPAKRGIVGDVLGIHEELGPYHFAKTPIRAILSQFLRDSRQGGMWLVRGVYPLNPVVPANIGHLVLYSEPLKINLANTADRF